MFPFNKPAIFGLSLIPVVAGSVEVPVETTGFVVDTSKRNEVVAFWNRVYQASEGFESRMGWSGSYGSTCNPGNTSAAFQADQERRINFYRAMAGIKASVLVNTGASVISEPGDLYTPSAGITKTAASQNAAMMFSYAGNITHSPPPAIPYSCWSMAAWNAADRSNLALGLHGPDALDGYMRENDPVTLSSWSPTVGHRRWMLMQGVTDFASGDVPGYLPHYQQANVLYAIPGLNEVESFTPRFVAWPSAGYFPDELVPTQWSLSHPAASFSSASVTMIDEAGGSVSVSTIDRTSLGQGHPTIVWSVPSSVVATSGGDDVSYQVIVSGIQIAGQTVSHSYEVTVMDPDRIHEDLELAGSAEPPTSGANYHFEPVESAEAYRLVVSKSSPADWVEGAESGDHIADGTGASYALRSSHYFGGTYFRRSGTRAFRLAFPSLQNDEAQTFTIDREIIAGEGSMVRFYARRGFMQTTSVLRVQISSDNSNWTTIGSLAGGSGNSWDDSGFVLRAAAIPSGTPPFRVRFRLSHSQGSTINTVDQGGQYAIGVFIDDITVTNAQWVSSAAETALPADASVARLDASTAGEPLVEGVGYGLRVVAELGGRDYPGEDLMAVTVGSTLSGYELWENADYPLLEGGFDADHDRDGVPNGVEYAFSTNPLRHNGVIHPVLDPANARLRLQQAIPGMKSDVNYGVEWSEDLLIWQSSGSEVVESAGVIDGSVPLGSGQRFIRWNVTRP